jgi:hypothetical protein
VGFIHVLIAMLRRRRESSYVSILRPDDGPAALSEEDSRILGIDIRTPRLTPLTGVEGGDRRGWWRVQIHDVVETRRLRYAADRRQAKDVLIHSKKVALIQRCDSPFLEGGGG